MKGIMSVEEVIQDMYNKYPTLFQTREQCMNHLLCTIGNGYYWDGCGGLIEEKREYTDDEGWPCVNLDDVRNISDYFVNGKAYQHFKINTNIDLIRYYVNHSSAEEIGEKAYRRYIQLLVAFAKGELEEKPIEPVPRKKMWYFFKNYSDDLFLKEAKVWTAPDWIASDWLELVMECRYMLKEDGFIFDYEKFGVA